MATLADLAKERTDLNSDDVEALQSLVAEWSLLSDIAFSDLVLWLPTWNDGGFVAAAAVRPTTGPTQLPHDVVGQFIAKGRDPILDRALTTKAPVINRTPVRPLVPSDEEAYPVFRDDRVIAVISRRSATSTRGDGSLERNYLEVFDVLIEMTTRGEFPQGPGVSRSSSPPRVGDGFLRIDDEGTVTFASPNAISACHRLGLAFGIDGQHLANTLMRLTRRPGPVNESLMLIAGGRASGETEVDNQGAVLALRGIPLISGEHRKGAVVLVRDISELRRRENALLTKDATIREIHHRVKNNLQTVAALLRLQSRRSESEEVTTALEEAQRRVAAIAAVHETLAHEPGTDVDFDEIAQRLVLMVRDMTRGMRKGSIHIEGEFGNLRSEHATALAMALTELVSNAVEHGIGLRETDGAVIVRVQRGATLIVDVEDDGPGFEGDAPIDGLGLSIVRTIIGQDLKGQLTIAKRETGGVVAHIEVPV
jgi:two-component sensor histidine kinase